MSSVTKFEDITEGTLQTELSSLPIETSDQNPKETPETSSKASVSTSSDSSVSTEEASTKISAPIESDATTVSRAIPSTDNPLFENLETTEFILTSSGSSESATDAVELIKISREHEQNAAIIEPVQGQKNNVLTDLINLVGDVASIGDHTDVPKAVSSTSPTSYTRISESEELISVNPGYKSKNSNWNLNSITEMVPVKTKSQMTNKQRVVEIEGEDTDTITDSPPPNDKVEPTTKRPIIDNVSDEKKPENVTSNKEIEIITKSYVPTINRRPTKIVMKKNNEKPVSEDTATEDIVESTDEETGTDKSVIPVGRSRTSTVSSVNPNMTKHFATTVAETIEEGESSPAVQ